MWYHLATSPTNLVQSSGTAKRQGVGHAIDGVADREETQPALQLQLGNA